MATSMKYIALLIWLITSLTFATGFDDILKLANEGDVEA